MEQGVSFGVQCEVKGTLHAAQIDEQHHVFIENRFVYFELHKQNETQKRSLERQCNEGVRHQIIHIRPEKHLVRPIISI